LPSTPSDEVPSPQPLRKSSRRPRDPVGRIADRELDLTNPEHPAWLDRLKGLPPRCTAESLLFTLLAQWRAECEVPYAFFVPMRGGIHAWSWGIPTIAHGRGSADAAIEFAPSSLEIAVYGTAGGTASSATGR
jgi:hypothetical protein